MADEVLGVRTVERLTMEQCPHCQVRATDLTGHLRGAHDLPCKHEWRQYMEAVVSLDRAYLEADGFFCIHCTEQKD